MWEGCQGWRSISSGTVYLLLSALVYSEGSNPKLSVSKGTTRQREPGDWIPFDRQHCYPLHTSLRVHRSRLFFTFDRCVYTHSKLRLGGGTVRKSIMSGPVVELTFEYSLRLSFGRQIYRGLRTGSLLCTLLFKNNKSQNSKSYQIIRSHLLIRCNHDLHVTNTLFFDFTLSWNLLRRPTPFRHS